MTELIHHFGIDWKLLLAQAVNFFILLLLLKKFAYRPILEMLKKRKEKVEAGLRFSKEAEETLGRVGEEREEVLKQARGEALKIITRSEQTAHEKGGEIIQQANKKVEEVIAAAKRLMEEEKTKVGQEVYREARGLVRLGLERVLGRMPARERDEILIQEALRELKSVK